VTRRTPAVLLVAAAAALQLGYTMPARARARGVADEYMRLRVERLEAAAALAASQRRQSALAAALEGASGRALSRDGAVAEARETIVAALGAASLSDVQLSVRPGTRPAAAVAHVAGSGPFRAVLAFSDGLVGPGTGLALDDVHFKPVAAGLAFDLSLVRVGARP
jgi:hypothetical protein